MSKVCFWGGGLLALVNHVLFSVWRLVHVKGFCVSSTWIAAAAVLRIHVFGYVRVLIHISKGYAPRWPSPWRWPHTLIQNGITNSNPNTFFSTSMVAFNTQGVSISALVCFS